jgi:hypothetical protein
MDARSYRTAWGTRVPPRSIALVLLPAWLAAAACAGPREDVLLTPGVQPVEAHVDVEAGLVSVERDGVVVSAEGVMLPEPRGDTPLPTFWITVENHRGDRVTVTPADVRLVDSFGNQLAPMPVSVDGSHDRELRYAVVDPRIHTYVALHFGWPYYPIYPYPGWYYPPRVRGPRYWQYDPFWTLGIGPVWIHEVYTAPRSRTAPSGPSEREEVIYADAKLTWVVVFPELERTVRDVRLIVPDIRLRDEEERSLDFEMTFRQIIEARR